MDFLIIFLFSLYGFWFLPATVKYTALPTAVCALITAIAFIICTFHNAVPKNQQNCKAIMLVMKGALTPLSLFCTVTIVCYLCNYYQYTTLSLGNIIAQIMVMALIPIMYVFITLIGFFSSLAFVRTAYKNKQLKASICVLHMFFQIIPIADLLDTLFLTVFVKKPAFVPEPSN